jgi:hypothetical protein
MAELKTKPNDASVIKFLESVEHPQKKKDSFTLLEMMKNVTGAEPIMWGGSIIGFGNYHYKYASGREGDWFQIGFSPRKQSLTLYLMGGLTHQAELLPKLGNHKTGKGCLYINKLSDVDLAVLVDMMEAAVKKTQ